MNENLRAAAIEGEAPVNPYSLLEAVNGSSRTARRSWLLLMASLGYLLVTVAGVTHADLLLARPVRLPLLQVDVGLVPFFLCAPALVVLAHMAVLVQLVILARKTLEFDAAMRMLEATDRRTHPLRLELNTFFLVQAIAGPQRSTVVGFFLQGVAWLTLVALPVAVLLALQMAFLPYHDAAVTSVHRAFLLADVVMLVLLGAFLVRPETSFLRAAGSAMRGHPVSLVLVSAGLGLVAAFSFLVATVPGEPLDRLAASLSRPATDAGGRRSEQAGGFLMPFLARPDGTLFGLLARNLDATDLDLAAKSSDVSARRGVVLRGRDLRYARLDRSVLTSADLTGADLSGASLVGADLRGARLDCDGAVPARAEDRGTVRCTAARGAVLANAQLTGARMAGLDLTGARLDSADVSGADLRQAVLAGASFTHARLPRAVLRGVVAPGASFAGGSLQGADLTEAIMAGADFTGAGLQGATLARANLAAATLRDADLEAADLVRARLHGADLRGARVRAADLRGAILWKTAAPPLEGAHLADLGQLVLAPPVTGDMARVERASAALAGRAREALTALAADSTRPWVDAADQQAWQALGAASAASAVDNYKVNLSDHLARLACRPAWADGSVATGVARRAQGPEFKGDVAAIHDRLKADDCPAGKALPKPLAQGLAAAAEAARGN